MSDHEGRFCAFHDRRGGVPDNNHRRQCQFRTVEPEIDQVAFLGRRRLHDSSRHRFRRHSRVYLRHRGIEADLATRDIDALNILLRFLDPAIVLGLGLREGFRRLLLGAMRARKRQFLPCGLEFIDIFRGHLALIESVRKHVLAVGGHHGLLGEIIGIGNIVFRQLDLREFRISGVKALIEGGAFGRHFRQHVDIRTGTGREQPPGNCQNSDVT